MSILVDRKNELYPELADAVFIQLQSDDLPEGLDITYTNVSTIICGDTESLKVNEKSYWGWYYKGSFQSNFDSPDEALANYRETFNKEKEEEMFYFESPLYWKNELKKAVGYLRAGKAKFAPTTTNSDVDVFLKKHKSL